MSRDLSEQMNIETCICTPVAFEGRVEITNYYIYFPFNLETEASIYFQIILT